jgi:NAD(P)-dependent dehydrogenase (short-subunit alcohol dehydrogenase family)
MTTQKIALVTGGNKGLGLEIARQLGQKGVTVLLGARDTAKGKDAAAKLAKEGFQVEFLQLDVESDAEIAAAVKTVESKFGKLDILVNNAGVGTDFTGPITRESFAKTLNINVIGPWAVTQAFTALLEKSGHGRVVNHSSILGSIGTLKSTDQMDAMFTSAYASSKTALNMLTVIASKALAAKKIKVNAAHPGWVKTDMGGEGAPMEIVDGAKTAVELALIGEDGPNGGLFHLGKPIPW